MQKHTLQKLIKNRTLKIAAYVLAVFASLLIVVLIAASIYLQNNKQKILVKIKEAFAKNVNGGLQIGNLDIAVWSHFPNIAVDLENVTVTDSLRHLPLFQAKEISCRVSIFQLATTKPDVEKLKITAAVLHLFIDSTGFDNSYLLSPKKNNTSSASTPASSNPIIVHRVELENCQFISEQALNHKRFDVLVHSASATIQREDSLLLISASEDCLIKGLGFNLEKGVFLDNATVKAHWQLRFNKMQKLLEARESNVEINKVPFRISAKFGFADSGMFTLHAAANEILYKQSEAILTQKIQKSLGFLDVTKPLKVDALLIGKLKHGGDPQVFVTITAVNNVLKTPQATFDACNFTGIYTNQIDKSQIPSDPNSVIYFNRFSGKWAGLELIGDSIRIDNLSNPMFFFNFHSQCTFPQLDNALNLKTINFDEGSATLNLQYKGPLTIDYSMFSNITGGLHIQSGKITYLPHNLQFENCNGDITFNKNNILIQKITCNYKKNKFEVTGSGNSINSAIMATGKAAVECNIFCPSFNAADFKTVFAKDSSINNRPKKASLGSAFAGVDNVLSKGDIQLNIKARELVLDNFTAQNARVSLLLQQNDWQVQRASLDFGGGSFLVDANLHKSGDAFSADARLNITNADVQKAFFAFNNFGQDAISYSNIRGTLNTSGTLQMQINNTGGIVPGTMQGTVNFSILNGALINFKPLLKIQDYAFKNRDLNNVSFAEIKDSLTVQQYRVLIPRMEISSTAMRIFVDGVYGIDTAATDISIQVPLSNLNKPLAIGEPVNKGTDAKTGPSIYLRAKSHADGKIKLGLDLFRKFRKRNEENK